MPWSSHEGGQKEQGEEEESLTSILNEDQRGELTLLIASITAAMRKTIESNFDASVSRHSCYMIRIIILLGWFRSKARAFKRPRI